MRPLRVHVVYEHGADLRPYSSAHIRLLRPLTHPSLQPWVALSAGPQLREEAVDLVVVDRLWKEDVSGEAAEELVDGARKQGARILYNLDDHLGLALERSADAAGKAERCAALDVFLRRADHVMVSTWPLAEWVRSINPHVSVVPNCLDERLLPAGALGAAETHRRRLAKLRATPDQPVTIGYMGTFTHDEDLAVVVHALRAIHRRHGSRVNIEIVGGVRRPETWSLFQGLPFREPKPGYLYTEYPTFMPWFCGRCAWDIGLAPLVSLPFNTYKSDIKFLDYAAAGTAGIYSRSAAYNGVTQHGVTGWLVDNTPEAWESALEEAVARPFATATIGWLAQRYLRQHRTLAVGSGMWLNTLRLTMTQDR